MLQDRLTPALEQLLQEKAELMVMLRKTTRLLHLKAHKGGFWACADPVCVRNRRAFRPEPPPIAQGHTD